MTARDVVVDEGPDVQLLGGKAALLQGAAALDVYRGLVEGIRMVRRRDHIEPSPRLLRAVAALKVAGGVASPVVADVADIADVRDGRTSASSAVARKASTEEVAQLLNVGVRQVRRLAPSLGGTKQRSGQWVFDMRVVRAYLEAESRNHD